MKFIRAIILSIVPIIAGEMVRGCNERAVAKDRADALNAELGRTQIALHDAQLQIDVLTKSTLPSTPTVSSR